MWWLVGRGEIHRIFQLSQYFSVFFIFGHSEEVHLIHLWSQLVQNVLLSSVICGCEPWSCTRHLSLRRQKCLANQLSLYKSCDAAFDGEDGENPLFMMSMSIIIITVPLVSWSLLFFFGSVGSRSIFKAVVNKHTSFFSLPLFAFEEEFLSMNQ